MSGTLTKITIQPGLQTDRTDYSTGPFWWKGSNVRFQNNDVEKIGGATAETDYTFTGSPSNKKIWTGLDGTQYLAVGTEQKLELVANGVKYDITPISSTAALGTDPLSVVDTSTTVTVSHTSHPAEAGNWVVISSATAVGGITIDGSYLVTAVVDANSYTIEHTAPATSTASGGGASVSVDYLLATGNQGTEGMGWSASSWGDTGSGWGSPATVGVTVEPAIWSMDAWGEDLVACRRGGTIYHWDATTGPTTRAAAVTGAPSRVLFIKVSPVDRHLLAFGAHNGTADDPLNIAWPDQETLTDWTPTTTNTAGSIRAEVGSRLVGASIVRGQMGVLTDSALYGLTYIGTPYTFGLKVLATGCGGIAQNSVLTYGDVMYWMAERDFWAFQGNAKILPCTVHDEVFDNIQDEAENSFFIGSNRLFNEVIFFYSLRGQDTVNRYASLNVIDGTWSLGSMSRTAWSDETIWYDAPLSFDSSGTLYYQDTGTDQNTTALTAYVESGAIELSNTEYKQGTSGSGDFMVLLDRFIPDATITGNLLLTIYYATYPGATEYSKGPYTITNSTDMVNVRIKGRQIRIRLESTDVGDTWRFGVPRIRVKRSGKR